MTWQSLAHAGPARSWRVVARILWPGAGDPAGASSSCCSSASGSTTRASSAPTTSPASSSGNAYIAIAAIGMSLVIISGNIDVSVGSLIGVLGTIAGTLAVNGYPIIVCLAGADRSIGIVINALVGVLVAYAAHPLDRGDAGHAVDPEGRPDQRHRRRLDQQHAAGFHDRAVPPLRHPLARSISWWS